MAETTTPTAPATPTTPATPKEKKAPRYVAVTMFPDLLKALDAACAATPERGELAHGTFIRDLLCEHFKLAKPTNTRAARKSYANEAEKAAAKAAIKTTRAKVLADLMAKHKAELEKAIAEAEAAALAKVRAEAASAADKPDA